MRACVLDQNHKCVITNAQWHEGGKGANKELPKAYASMYII